MAIIDFDSSKVDPQDSFDPVPVGEYKAIIESSEMKRTKQGTGSYLQLTFKIIDGKHKNRLIFDRLNINNPNKQTVEIAERALSAICHAVNVIHPKDSAELHNKPMVIKVGIRKGSDGYADQNEIKGYKDIKGAAPKETQPPETTGGNTTNPEKMPWEN